MRIPLCSFFAILLFTIFNLSAEAAPALAEKAGKWSFSMNEPDTTLAEVSKEKQQKIRSSLQEIARIITSVPVMNPPRGFEARFWGTVSASDSYYLCAGKKCPTARPTATLAMMLGRYELQKGKVRAAFNTPATMDISLNNLGHLFSHLPVLYKDDDGYLVPEPQLAGERAGMRAYINNDHAVAVMTSSDRPLWLPVSRERYLRAAIAATDKSLEGDGKGKQKQPNAVSIISGKPVMIEESRTWIDPVEQKKWVESSRSLTFEIKEPLDVLKARLAKFQAELDALTPEQRTMPARVASASTNRDEVPSLAPADSSSGVAVVSPDFSYFNTELPPEAVQLMVVQWKFDGKLIYDPQQVGISETLNNQRLLEIYRSMDWRKLGALITRTAP